MVRFYSEYNVIQGRYEQACRETNASDPDARAARRQSIEDSLVEGGADAIANYEALLNDRARRANCLAEFDGIAIGRGILKRAKERLAVQ